MSHPDPQILPNRTPIQIGEVLENPVTGERATMLELPHQNAERRLVAELLARAGATFNSVEQLREHIHALIDNHHAKPFIWTKTEVFQRRAEDHRVSPNKIPGTDDVSCGF